MDYAELALYDTLTNPVGAVELLVDMKDENVYPPKVPTRIYYWQYPMLMAPEGVFCGGRDTGKSTIGVRLRTAFTKGWNKPYGQWISLLIAEKEGGVMDFLSRISRIFELHPILRHWSPKESGTSQIQAKFFENAFGQRVEIGWPGRDRNKMAPNLVGKRADDMVLDEYQAYDRSELDNIFPILRREPSSPDEAEAGAQLLHFGFPNGQPSALKEAWDKRTTKEYKDIFYNFPSFLNPTYTMRKWIAACRKYGCDIARGVYSPEYYNQVCGWYTDTSGSLRCFPDRILRHSDHDFQYRTITPEEPHYISPIDGYPLRYAGMDVGIPGTTALHIYGWDMARWYLVRIIHLVGFTDTTHLSETIDDILNVCKVNRLGMDAAAQGKGIHDILIHIYNTPYEVIGFASGNQAIEVPHSELTGLEETREMLRKRREWGVEEEFVKMPVSEISIYWLAEMMRTETIYFPTPTQCSILWEQLQAYSRNEGKGRKFVPPNCHDVDAAKYFALVNRLGEMNKRKVWEEGQKIVERLFLQPVR